MALLTLRPVEKDCLGRFWVRHVLGWTLNMAGIVLIATYVLALVPIVLLGLVANADYGNLGCPGAMQCSDASSARTLALAYVLTAPVVFLVSKVLRVGARALKSESEA